METKRIVSPGAEKLLNLYFPILNHGFCSLKDYMGADASVEEAARTSYSYGTRQKGDQEALIRSMMRRGHTSPFEQLELKFHVGMPIMVARQWVRHRTASLNELSGRYSLMPMLFYTPDDRHVLAQSKNDKQGRMGNLPVDHVVHWKQRLKEIRRETVELYEWACNDDFARELARIDLPYSTYTVWYWKIDVHNLFKFLSLRCEDHAQWEIRQYANTIAQMLKSVAPMSFQAWEDYHYNSVKFSRAEFEKIKQMLYVKNVFNTKENKETKVICTTEKSFTNKGILEQGDMSKTELKEFFEKFERVPYDFLDIDITRAKSPEHFEKMFKESAEKK